MIDLMPQVQNYNTTLSNLEQWWQKVTLIGKINSLGIAATIIEDMNSTREKLAQLQRSLLDSLIHENLHKLDRELSAKAQVAIDILIRNLFERTADVGFLATDDDLRSFLRTSESTPEHYDAIVARLREYTSKYSVYDEIVVVDPSGQVKVHLDDANPVTFSKDPLIAKTIDSSAPYVETFGHSDLQPNRHHALIYSAKITDSNNPGAPLLGILCLCFRFDDEMNSIFTNLLKEDEIISILDSRSRVIACSHPDKVGIGNQVHLVLDRLAGVTQHSNLKYVSKSAQTSGYQGFHGLSWQGHVMKPAATAFPAQISDENQSSNLLRDSDYFSEELRHIRMTANTIIDDLILVVLNGQIISAKRDAKEFMPVLDEIRNIGTQTKHVFDESISNLYDTVITSLLFDVQFHAFLAVDIMDRNLYERANDVRWWALTTKFRELMTNRPLPRHDFETLTSILIYINSLYTVYTNIFLFDTGGKIIAVSNPEKAHLIDQKLPMDRHFRAAIEIPDSQKYAVSPFEPTELYDDRPTYIYLTSILATEQRKAVGGIGIVFDSEPQFQAMLRDALPRDNSGKIIESNFGVFADSQRRVIASTNSSLSPGDTITLDNRFFSLTNGQRTSFITTFQGSRFAVGAAMSQGYREYKTTGDYQNDVISLIFVPV